MRRCCVCLEFGRASVVQVACHPVVRYDAKAGERSLDVMRWGLVPFRAKDIKVGFSNINAKAEGSTGSGLSSGGAASFRDWLIAEPG